MNFYFFLADSPCSKSRKTLFLLHLMSKRIATFQISDRNPVDPSDEEENYSNSSGSEKEERASEQELRQRK